MRNLAGVASAFMLVAVLGLATAVQAATTRTLVVSDAGSNPLTAFGNFDASPKLFDFDGDGSKEIVAQNDNQWAYVIDSHSGAVLAELTTTFPPGWEARSFNTPEAAAFDSSGTVRIILENSAAYVTSFRFDPAASTTGHFAFVKEWEYRLDDCFGNPGADSKPVLADLDEDGRYEIIASTEEYGLYALHDDGTLYWKNCIGGGNAEPAVADINLDGWLDVVFGSDGGVVSAHDGRNGNYLWAYNALAHHDLQSGSMPVGVAIGQLDGKLGPDIVVGARDSHDPINFGNDHAMLLAIDSQGKLLWAAQDPQGNPLTYTHPIIADAAGDGQMEVYWGDWNTIGHKPPADEADAWKVTGPGHFYRYDAQGNLAWKHSLDSYWSNNDLALADADGDGDQDVIANGRGSGGDGFWYLDSATGSQHTFVSTAPWKVTGSPIVADLWSTGTMQWVVEVAPNDGSVTGGGLLVYDTGVAYDAKWPHLADPTLTGAVIPALGIGPFAADFTIHDPNPMWQQVEVKPDPERLIVGVDVRIAGGAWQPMVRSPWGHWTSSYPAAAGQTVEFVATEPSGEAAQSAGFFWLDGTMDRGSVPLGSAPPEPSEPTPADPVGDGAGDDGQGQAPAPAEKGKGIPAAGAVPALAVLLLGALALARRRA
ncbi:MAG: hypothetical protein QOJ26_572 [Thermoplasmata archaeon]|nr:hypothetical protein [Thermoplasmata archaeon]